MKRFDDCVRSERYFTATLMPLLLFHDNFAGLRAFVKLIESRAFTEHTSQGQQVKKVTPFPEYVYSDPEIITEFHIARDLRHCKARLVSHVSETKEKKDAPDLVLVLGQELIVLEAKFFGPAGLNKMKEQLQSQKLQVRHLFENRPLRAWRHVALIPRGLSELTIESLQCDVVITWKDMADLAKSVLGKSHYVTRRLKKAVARYRNYESMLPLVDVLKYCHQPKVLIGQIGGLAKLRLQGLEQIQNKKWKWRRHTTPGYAKSDNWISGAVFAELVACIEAETKATGV